MWESLTSERFDPSALWRRVDGDMQLLAELVKIFAAEYPELLLKIDSAARDGDAETLREASHKLKGSLLQLSAPVAAQAAADLERLAASNSLNDAVLSVNTLKKEIDFLVRLLEAMASSGQARANKAGEN
ncbi:MAG TPA: Hpt domain-containing protein [Candidatus Angelobacter sp.]|nr:Hpt domain-containing protein [Candidatus Angelobacter sp.]